MVLLPLQSVQSILQVVPSLKVLVIGDGMLDHYISGDAERISPEAPVPVVSVDRETYHPGGACNVALNAKSLGANVTFLGVVGTDEAGCTLQRLLKEADIGFCNENFRSDVQTIVKTRVIARHQQLCRLDREKKFSEASVAAVIAQAEAFLQKNAVSAVLVSDYAKGTVTQALLDKLVELKKHYSFFLAVDPKPKNKLCYNGVDLLKPNRTEALQLANFNTEPNQTFSSDAVAREILNRHSVRYLTVTLGEQGVALAENGGSIQTAPAVAKEVFDVSGAGDTALAALAIAFCAHHTPSEAIAFANLLSGIVIRKVGTAVTTPEEILAYASKTLGSVS